jgi:predicted phosphodiesterase
MISSFCFISDIHSQYDRLKRAVDYAESQHLQIVFLGDIFDSKVEYGDSIGTLNLIERCVKLGHICLNSNHQDKLIRYLKGNNVRQNNGLDVTIKEFANSDVDKNNLYRLLVSFPYGVIMKNSEGKEFRVAHAYFPHSLRPASNFVYRSDINRKYRDMMIYGKMDKENIRVKWWETENENQNYVRVSGHYHTVFIGNQSIVLDSGCGSDPLAPLSLYNVESGAIKEF